MLTNKSLGILVQRQHLVKHVIYQGAVGRIILSGVAAEPELVTVQAGGRLPLQGKAGAVRAFHNYALPALRIRITSALR